MNSIDYGILKTQYKSHLFYVDNHQNLNIIIIEIHMGVKGTTTTTTKSDSLSFIAWNDLRLFRSWSKTWSSFVGGTTYFLNICLACINENMGLAFREHWIYFQIIRAEFQENEEVIPLDLSFYLFLSPPPPFLFSLSSLVEHTIVNVCLYFSPKD